MLESRKFCAVFTVRMTIYANCTDTMRENRKNSTVRGTVPGRSHSTDDTVIEKRVYLSFLQLFTTKPESATRPMTFGMTMSWLKVSVSSQTRSLESREPRKIKRIAMME